MKLLAGLDHRIHCLLQALTVEELPKSVRLEFEARLDELTSFKQHLLKQLEMAPVVLQTHFEGFEIWSDEGYGTEPTRRARLIEIEEL